MPRVRFLEDYIYTPTLERRVSTKFKASAKPQLVNRDCADKAIAAGAAELSIVEASPPPAVAKPGGSKPGRLGRRRSAK